MTRAYGSQPRRPTQRRYRYVPKPRDASIRRLAFTCFHLVAIRDRDPGEAPYAAIELANPANTMIAFTLLACDQI